MIQIVKRLLRWFSIVLLVTILILFVAFLLFTQSKQQLAAVTLNPFQDIKMLYQLRQDLLSTPRQLNRFTEFKISQLQLNKAVAIQLSSQPSSKKWQSIIKIQPKGLSVNLEIPIKLGLIQRYLPLTIEHQYNQWQQPLTQVSVNKTQLPTFILNAINRRLIKKLQQQKGIEFVQQSQLLLFAEQDQLVFKLLWTEALQQRFSDRQTQVPPWDTQSLYASVVQQVNQMSGTKLSLAGLFGLIARQQLARPSIDPVNDFWLVAATIVGKQPLISLTGLDYIHVNKAITLNQRVDLARHFTYSGFLEHNAGSLLANAIGAIKEQQDAKNKSTKFSYSDSAANQAGIYFAVWLAKLEQAPLAMSQLTKDRQIMIDVAHLAEGIDLPVASDYRRQIQLFKNQIQSLPLYRR